MWPTRVNGSAVTSPSGDDLADEYAELARDLASLGTPADVMERLTAEAVSRVDGASDASLTVLSADRFTTLAATGELPRRVDAWQYEFGGPCVDVLVKPDPEQHVSDLRTDARWPQFASTATTQSPLLSMASYRLYLKSDKPIASLNLYGTDVDAFGPRALRVGRVLAALAAPALTLAEERRRGDNLERALESNREIGVAMGILMTRHLITRDQAFAVLRSASQHGHRKLREIASHVIETGTLPPMR